MYIPSPGADSLLAFIRIFSSPESSVLAVYFGAPVVEGTSPLKKARALIKFVKNESIIQSNSSPMQLNW